jgi:hypothetical protein
MKLHPLFACAAALALCGCTSFGDMFNARDERPAPAMASGFMPLMVAAVPSGFCQDIAASDRLRASLAGFDASTLNRFSEQSLQQCNVVWAGANTRFERMASR